MHVFSGVLLIRSETVLQLSPHVGILSNFSLFRLAAYFHKACRNLISLKGLWSYQLWLTLANILKRYGKQAVSCPDGTCTLRRQNDYLHCVFLETQTKKPQEKQKVLCFIANPVTNMLWWFMFKSILIFLPHDGFYLSFWSLDKGNKYSLLKSR